MEVKTEKNVIKTDGAHLYDQDERDPRFYRCRDCGTKVSNVEIDSHLHRHRCKGDQR